MPCRLFHDLRRFASRKCLDYTLLRGDARVLAEKIGPHDLAIFSPPYPNSFDYTDVYNVELWALGYLNGAEANSRLRHATLRSHVQLLRDFENNTMSSPTLITTIDALRQVREKLWNPHIPEMIGAYAADLAGVIADLWACLRIRGRVYMVLGDSRYAGIDVPVAKIVAEITRSIGFEVLAPGALSINAIIAATRRSSRTRRDARCLGEALGSGKARGTCVSRLTEYRPNVNPWRRGVFT